LLGVVNGAVEPQARDYMRSLLRRPPFSAHSSLGGGLPPGSLHENKIGSAYDTLQDIMYAELSNGRRLIVAAFTNGWNQDEPEPWDVARLGDFTARLLHELRLDDAGGGPPTILEPAPMVDADAVRWHWRAPQAGRYELALWFDADPANTPDARAAIVASGTTKEIAAVNQSTWGRRWIRLGDVDLDRGKVELLLTRSGPGHLAPGRLRVARWPDAQAR
jgi:hypothetical protein